MAALLQTPTVFVIRRAASTPARPRRPTNFFPGPDESSADRQIRVGPSRGGQGPSPARQAPAQGPGPAGARLARERSSLRSFHADKDFFAAGVDMVIGILEDTHTLIACPPCNGQRTPPSSFGGLLARTSVRAFFSRESRGHACTMTDAARRPAASSTRAGLWSAGACSRFYLPGWRVSPGEFVCAPPGIRVGRRILLPLERGTRPTAIANAFAIQQPA
jgi:hypothetical protein